MTIAAALLRCTRMLPIHVLYENPSWLPPLEAALEAEGLSYELHEIWRTSLDPSREPPPGIYLNRMSPSSHTRGHHESVALMHEMLAWLEHHGRRVINGARAFRLEVSKFQQDLVLRRHGIATPDTILVVGRDAALAAAERMSGPFITKHNQGGKGLGIRLYRSADELAAHFDAGAVDAGPNGQIVLQAYIRSAEPFITRVEIVAGRFLYAMRSSTEDGFELCPSDACQLPASSPDVCPADGTAVTQSGAAKFTLAPITADDPLIARYLALCVAEHIDVAGIEFVEDAAGGRYTYDINGTTNYNSAVGRAANTDGMREIARFAKHLATPTPHGANALPSPYGSTT